MTLEFLVGELSLRPSFVEKLIQDKHNFRIVIIQALAILYQLSKLEVYQMNITSQKQRIFIKVIFKNHYFMKKYHSKLKEVFKIDILFKNFAMVSEC